VDDQLRPVDHQRQYVARACEVGRQACESDCVDVEFAQTYICHAELLGQRTVEFVLIDLAGGDQQAAESLAGVRRLRGERTMYARVTDGSGRGQQHTDRLAMCRLRDRECGLQARSRCRGLRRGGRSC